MSEDENTEATAAEVTDAPTAADEAHSDAVDEAHSETAGEPETAKPGRLRRWRGRIAAAALVLALAASAGLAGWLYYFQFRPDQQTDQAAADAAVNAAKGGTVALLSYAPDSLDKDFANARTHLTGDFLSYYNDFTQQIVTPAAKQKQVKTSADVINAGLSEIHPDSAVVLVFLNQTTTSSENPDGAFSASSVKVGLTKHDGTWLISSFDPV